MSDQQITVNPKQLLTFLGIALVITTGAVVFFFKSSGQKSNPTPPSVNSGNSAVKTNDLGVGSDGFLGEKGLTVQAIDGKVFIDEAQVEDGNLHAFNYFSQTQGKTIYFFVVKASDGTYRAAANACEVCYDAKTGFKQIDDQIRCENCRTMYSKDQIALQKGGCNPRPIDKDVEVIGGQLAINSSDIEKTADLF